MRKLYNAEVLEETKAALTFEVAELKKEMKSLKQIQSSLKEKYRETEASHDENIKKMEERMETISGENRRLKSKYNRLQTENNELNQDCENLKDAFAEASSKLFTAELEMDKAKKEGAYLQNLEDKVQEQQIKMMKLSDENFFLQRQIKLERNDCAAQVHQSEMLTKSYARELDYLKHEHRESLGNLELYMQRSDRLDGELKDKEEMIADQKTKLENAQALLRSQLEAVEGKYSTQKNITQRLEIQVMDLFSRLTAYEGEVGVNVGQKSTRIPERSDW